MCTTFQLDTSRFCDEVFAHLRSHLDVTILIGGRRLFGNRLIMATMSSYFQQALSGQEEKNPVINLGNGATIDAESLGRILEFMHQGYVSLDTKDESLRFISLAKSLGVRNWERSPVAPSKLTPKLTLDVAAAIAPASTDPSEADTDIEEEEEDPEGNGGEVATILRHISYAVSMSRQAEDGGAATADSGIDSRSIADSLESSKRHQLEPIRAKKVKGICGDHWQCLDCQYWCYNDTDIRRHERRLRHISEETADVAKKPKDDTRLKTMTPRKYALRARAKKLGGICGDYYQCQGCPYWNYNRKTVRAHQLRMRH